MLISFEGLPGAGKSTQAALLTACLTHRGLPTVTLPDLATLDTDPVAATLIELFASSGDPYLRHGDAVTDTLLAAAIRADIDLAVCWVQTLAALTGQRTGYALWLRLPVNEALRRASHRNQRAPTSEQRSYLQWVHEAYTELAQRDPQLTVLDVGTRQPAEVHHAVHLALRELGLNLAGADATSGRCAGLPHVAGGPA
jgi:thymidylate kinase